MKKLANDDLERLYKEMGLRFNPDIDIESRTINDYQLCFLIKNGYHGILDVSRTALTEIVQDIIEYVKILSGMIFAEDSTHG